MTYLWGLDLSGSMQGAGGVGGLLSIVASNGTTRYYPAYDGNGNVSEYVNQSGTRVAHFEYDPFGNLTVDRDSNAASFPYRFSTKPQDLITGLYYYGYRWYDPLTGRWPSRDPIEEMGGINLYGFVGNNGVNGFDLLGQLIGRCCGSVVAAFGNEILNDDGINRYNDATGENSMTHCFLACLIEKACGDPGTEWWNSRENPDRPTGAQDLANNQIGINFAEAGDTCWPSCLNAWNNKGLNCGGNPCPPRQ